MLRAMLVEKVRLLLVFGWLYAVPLRRNYDTCIGSHNATCYVGRKGMFTVGLRLVVCVPALT